MSLDPRIVEALLRYEASLAQGKTPTPEELGIDGSLSVEELRKHLDRLRELAVRFAVSPGGPTLADPSAPAADAPAVPQVPGYEVLEELGRGGMGVVYRARQVRANRIVALKLIRAGAYATATERARFRTEAEAIARLQHPNIVQVFEVGEHDSLPFFSLEYCPGGNLADRLKGAPLEPQTAAALIEQLARALHNAHEAGIVHRDLKPANVLLSGEARASNGEPEKYGSLVSQHALLASPKLTDFGLAKRLHEAGMTQTGAVMGTPSYMAPEQARGLTSKIGPAVDVYALGALLYECITGRPPFKAPTDLDTLYQVVHAEAVSPSQLAARVPRDLNTICLKCLHKEPERRYASAAALAEDLRRFRAGEPIAARPIGRAERAWRWCQRNPSSAALVAAVALLLIAGTTVASILALAATRNARQAKKNEEQARVSQLEAEANRRKADNEALNAKEKEEKAREAEERANRKADDERRALERMAWMFHASQIARAQSSWQDGNVQGARTLLDEARWDLRGWEHRYLHTLFNGSHRTLTGHTDWVTSVACSPREDIVATGSRDGTIKLWDLHSGRETRALTDHRGGITSICFSADANYLASASRDGTIVVWSRANSWKRTYAMQSMRQEALSVAFHPNSTRLAGGFADGTIVLWSLEATSKVITKYNQVHGVVAVAFSPDGTRLLSTDNTLVRTWDMSTNHHLRAHGVHNDKVAGACFSPDGRWVASAGADEFVYIWDAKDGAPRHSLKRTAKARCVAFSPDSTRLACGADDGTVKVWDVQSGEEQATFRGHADKVTSVAFDADSFRLVSGSEDNTARLWDLRAGQDVRTLHGHTDRVVAVACSPDGTRLLSGSEDRSLRLWDLRTGKLLRAIKGLPNRISCVQYSPDGRRLAASTSAKLLGQGEVKVYDAATGAELMTYQGSTRDITSFCFSPDGKQIAIACGKALGRGEIRVCDALTGQFIRVLYGASSGVLSVCYSQDGSKIAAGFGKVYDQGEVRIWETVSGKELHVLKGHAGGVASVAFDMTGKLLAGGQQDGAVTVWECSHDGVRELRTLKAHAVGVTGVAFSPDSERLATSSKDGTIRLWELRHGQEVLTLKEPGEVLDVRFDVEGTRLVAGCGNKTIKIWSALDRSERLYPRGYLAKARRAAFTEQGGKLIVYDDKNQRALVDCVTGDQLPVAANDTIGEHEGAASPDGQWTVAVEQDRVWISPVTANAAEPWRRFAEPDPDWHEQQARTQLEGGDLFAAGFHLGRQLRYRPWDATAHSLRAFILTRLEQPGLACGHYLQAVTLAPQTYAQTQENWSAGAAIEAAQVGQWNRAAILFELSMRKSGLNWVDWENLLLTRRAAGQTAAAQQSLVALMKSLADGSEARVGVSILYLWQHVPCPQAECERLLALARSLAARQAVSRDVMGVILYRAGQCAEAATALEQYLSDANPDIFVPAGLFLAMAEHRLGRHGTARTLFERWEQRLKATPPRTWREQLRHQLLLEEARSVLQTMQPADE